MKKMLLLAGVLALAWSSVATADVLVQSWGFESPGANEWQRIWPWFQFYDWQSADTTTYRAERAAHSGDWGLVLTHPADTPDDHKGTPYAMWGIPYEPGKSYRISYWAKTDGVMEFHGLIQWRSPAGEDGVLAEFDTYTGTEWEQFEYEFVAPDQPDLVVVIFLWPRPRKTDGEVYVDDVEVWQIGVYTPVEGSTWGKIKATFK